MNIQTIEDETWCQCLKVVFWSLFMEASYHVRNKSIYVLSFKGYFDVYFPFCESLCSSVGRFGPLSCIVSTLRLRQNCHHFADDIFRCIFFNENIWISLKILLKFVPKFQINNIPALVLIMAWHWPGDKPLSEQIPVVYWRIYVSLSLNESIKFIPSQPLDLMPVT